MDATPLPVISLWSPHGATVTTRTRLAWQRVEGVAASPLEALRRASQQCPGRDVLLLHVEAQLSAEGCDRLMAGLAGGQWDIVSPLDPSCGLYDPSIPTRQADAAAWAWGEHQTFAWHGWSSVCSLWRASVAAASAPGQALPLRTALLPCVYAGGPNLPPASSPGEAVERLRDRLRADKAHDVVPALGPVVLHVMHAWGGGVERFARDLAEADSERQYLFLFAQGDQHFPPFGKRLCLHVDLDAPPVRTWALSRPIDACALESAELGQILAQIIEEWGVGAVLVSSLVGLALDVLRTNLQTSLCFHDVFPLWPLLHDPHNPETQPFDESALVEAFSSGAPCLFPSRDAQAWLALRDAFVRTVLEQGVRLVAPSEFARRRALAIAPELCGAPWDVQPHGIAPLTPVPPPSRAAGQPLRVLVPGHIHGGKGEQCLAAMLRDLPEGLEFFLLGCGNAGEPFEGLPRITVISEYQHSSLAGEVERIAPDIALIPGHVPETFSYVLSEMLALGVPVLCSRPGATTERMAELGRGFSATPDPNALLARLLEFSVDRATLEAERNLPPPALPGLTEMAAAWRRILPCAPARPRLESAGQDSLRMLHAEQLAVRSLDALGAERLTSQALRGELDSRTKWVRSIQDQAEQAEKDHGARLAEAERAYTAALVELNAKLASSETRQQRDREDLEARYHLEVSRLERELVEAQRNHGLEIDRLEAERSTELRMLKGELSDAHGYYQRDVTDLARQRDVALRQRDDALDEIATLKRSRIWRATELPRRAARNFRTKFLAARYHALHLRALINRGFHSLRTRGIRDTWQRLRTRHASQPADEAVPMRQLEADGDLRLQAPPLPRASIIIPVYGKLDFTMACLRSLARSGDATLFEVIVVDDGSPDDTPHVLPGVPGLRYLRNASNLGFVGACNVGAAIARGEFVVFLNNDTTVRPGWLDALLSTFAKYPDTGLAGAKLVYPDGRLQEAGGMIFADGSGWNYGRFEDPDHPRFGFVREVDYCSGAAIALPRRLFDKLGGFDDHYSPAYYEDTDLAMRVRSEGLKVRYQPAAEVVHHEGVTSGTDTRVGVKRHQITNQAKFLARWRDVLAAEHAPAGSNANKTSERGRAFKVLVLDACTPTPDKDSGSLRMTAILRLLRELGCSVVFFPENRAHDGRYTEALQQMGVEAWWHPYLGDIPSWLAEHGPSFDLVIASRHYVIEPVLPLLRTHARRAHLVFDTVDLHYLRELREASHAGNASLQRRAERTRHTELALIGSVDSTWVVSDAELRLLQAELPAANVCILSNIHEVNGPGRPRDERTDILFVGSYRHPPNVDAANWLVGDILPRIRDRLPGVRLHLVGGDAPEDVVALGNQPGVVFHGYVPDLGPLLEGSRIGLAPLRYGAGVKGKVNQALAHGLPVVATSCAVEGMFLADGDDVLVADDSEAFATAVVRLYEDPALWARLAEGGLENTRKHFSSEAARKTLRTLLASLRPR